MCTKNVNKKKPLTVVNCKWLILLARSKRFELLTYRFVACCSIQLSHERIDWDILLISQKMSSLF